jgi:hypothetical protein
MAMLWDQITTWFLTVAEKIAPAELSSITAHKGESNG